MTAIARLTPVNLREVWPNEAADFTPWLADNLDGLSEALGIDLELERIEAPVGSFSVDILARDVNENRTVVIENQLEATNHDHLGKVLTYAAGYNADVMVWIVREFRDEHRQALDWLNQRTGEGTEFYGVVVKAVRIGDSPAAFIFDVVAQPSTFRKSNVARIDNATGQAYLTFWQGIVDRLRDSHRLTNSRKSTSDSWKYFAVGVKDISYEVAFSKTDARTGLWLGSPDRRRNKAIFDRLRDYRGLEEAFGESLDWERLDGYKSSRIAMHLPGKTINDPPEALAHTADWMVSTIVQLSRTVIPIVREVAAEVDRELATEPSAGPATDALGYDDFDEE